jgi:hypothetical protein
MKEIEKERQMIRETAIKTAQKTIQPRAAEIDEQIEPRLRTVLCCNGRRNRPRIMYFSIDQHIYFQAAHPRFNSFNWYFDILYKPEPALLTGGPPARPG